MEIAKVVTGVRDILGAKLTAYLAGVKTTREVRDWADGQVEPPADTAARLEFALEIAQMITRRDSKAVAQAWFQGMNPMLEDTAPATAIREGDLSTTKPAVFRAADNFAFHG